MLTGDLFSSQVYREDAKDLMWRPPPNNNGTPNESVGDVFVRVRQVLCLRLPGDTRLFCTTTYRKRLCCTFLAPRLVFD